MKRVLVITPPLIERSGWGRYSLAVIKGLKERDDLRVTVVSERGQDAIASNHVLEPLTSLGNFAQNVRTVRELSKDADIVHALESWPHGVYGLFAVMGTRKKLFVNAVGTYSFAPLRSFLKGIALRAAYRRAQAIPSISSYTTEKLRAVTGRLNIRTIHLGLNPLPQVTPEDVECAKATLSLTKFHPLVVTVGQVKHRKGQLDTLKAIDILREEYPSIGYAVIGRTSDTEYVGKVRAYAAAHGLSGHLFIHSNATDTDLACLYAAADAVALNSNNDGDNFEGFGMVLVEASSYGAPTVGSADTGIMDAIEDGYSGYLTHQGDPQDIADKLKKIFTGDRSLLAKHAREFASRFSWQKTINEYVRLYNESI